MCIFFLIFFFFFNDTATTEIYTLSDTLSYTTLFRSFNVNALRTSDAQDMLQGVELARSEEHTSELQSPLNISYAVFCLKKKKKILRTETYAILQKLITQTIKQLVPSMVLRASYRRLEPVSSFFFFFFLMIRRPPRSTR